MMRLLSQMVSDLKNYDRLGKAERAELLEATRPTAQQFLQRFFYQPKENIRECTAFLPFRSDLLLAQARVSRTRCGRNGGCDSRRLQNFHGDRFRCCRIFENW